MGSDMDYDTYCGSCDALLDPYSGLCVDCDRGRDHLVKRFDSDNTQEDIVQQPSHYSRFDIEPALFIMKNNLPFHVGNIIKYACRAGYKQYEGKDGIESEITDLEKVQRYAEMRINQLRGEEKL